MRNPIPIPIPPLNPTARAPQARRRLNTIHSPERAATPAKGISRNGIPAIGITATMDGARAISADAAGSASRTAHAEAVAVRVGKVDKAEAVESRYHALRSHR